MQKPWAGSTFGMFRETVRLEWIKPRGEIRSDGGHKNAPLQVCVRVHYKRIDHSQICSVIAGWHQYKCRPFPWLAQCIKLTNLWHLHLPETSPSSFIFFLYIVHLSIFCSLWRSCPFRQGNFSAPFLHYPFLASINFSPNQTVIGVLACNRSSPQLWGNHKFSRSFSQGSKIVF